MVYISLIVDGKGVEDLFPMKSEKLAHRIVTHLNAKVIGKRYVVTEDF